MSTAISRACFALAVCTAGGFAQILTWWEARFGNKELEYYTDRPQNLYLDGGMLTIKAMQEHCRDDFHVYAVEWEPNAIRWYVDGKQYHSVSPADLAANGPAPRTQPHSSQTIVVNYVRVYRRE